MINFAEVTRSHRLYLLKKHEGEVVDFLYRGKFRKFKLIAVQLDSKHIVKNGKRYKGNIGDIRLDYAYPSKNRQSDGFWTNNIFNVRLHFKD